VNKETSHYVRLFGGNKIGNLIFRLLLTLQLIMQKPETSSKISTTKCCAVLKLLIPAIYCTAKTTVVVLLFEVLNKDIYI
jgi:hypothetical protein